MVRAFPKKRENAEMNSKSRRFLQFLILLLVGACSLGAQSKSPEDLAAGKLLVAPRDSPDPIFGESVILLVRYSQKTGALGLMLTRQTKTPISRLAPDVKGAAGHSDPLFAGGPVELDAVFALARAPSKPTGATAVSGDVYFIQTKTAMANALGKGSGPSVLRVYLGYCGWGRNQLETEVSEGRWFIFDGSQDLAFDAHPETLWSRLIRRTEEHLAWIGQPPRATRISLRTSPASE